MFLFLALNVNIFNIFNFASVKPGDLIAVAIIFTLSVFYMFALDPHNMLVNLFSTYFAFLVVIFLPLSERPLLNLLGHSLFQIVLFFFSLFICAILLSATHLFRINYIKNFFLRSINGVINGFLYSCLVLSVLLSLLPDHLMAQFSPSLIKFLIGSWQRLIWLFLPILALFITRKKRKTRLIY